METVLILNVIGAERQSVKIRIEAVIDVPDDYVDANDLPEIAKEFKEEVEADIEGEPVKIERFEIACVS